MSEYQLPQELQPYFATPPMIRTNDRHSRVGRFPAVATYEEDLQLPVVYFDEKTYLDFVDNYATTDFTSDMIRTLYVEGGIASVALRDSLSLESIEEIQYVHGALSSADNLANQIMGATFDNEISDRDERNLLLALHEGVLVPDIAILNGARLALETVMMLHGEAGEEMRDGFQKVALQELLENLQRWDLYKQTRLIFDEEDAESIWHLFVNQIPTIEVIGAFPMPRAEAAQLIQRIAQPD